MTKEDDHLDQVLSIVGKSKTETKGVLSEAHLKRLIRHLAKLPSQDQPMIDDSNPALEKLVQYRVIQKIGQGGMGEVYLAHHEMMKRDVAIKTVRSNRDDPESRKRFVQEIIAAAKVNHPNLVQAFDACEVDSSAFLVMEFVSGQNVSDIAKNWKQLPVGEACEIVRQAAVGLDHAHHYKQGLVHRDVKPSNLILSDEGIVKVLDLGLAKPRLGVAEHELTSTGQFMGTVDYMAPEQVLDAKSVDHRADLYSLGATLYRLLSGQAPFEGEEFDSVGKRLFAIETRLPRSVRTIRTDIPVGLADIVDSLLAKNPDERPSSGAELAEQLRPFCANSSDLVKLVSDKSRTSGGQVTQSTFATADASLETDYPRKHPPKESKQPQLHFSSSWIRKYKIWLAVACIPILIALAIVIRLKMPGEGELVIRVEGDGVRIKVTESDGDQQDLLIENSEKTIMARSGPYDVEIIGADPDEFEITSDSAVLKKNGQVVVTIRRIGGSSDEVETTNSDHLSAATPSRSPLEPYLTDYTWKPGRKSQWPGLVSRPCKLNGIKRWQIETVMARLGEPVPRWSPDGTKIATFDTGIIRVHSLADSMLQLDKVFYGSNHAWSHDGKRIAAFRFIDDQWNLVVWDIEKGTSVSTPIPSRHFRQVCWSDDDGLVACSIGDQPTVFIYGSKELDSVRDIQVKPGSDNWDEVHCIDWKDNKLFIVHSNRFDVFNPISGKKEQTRKIADGRVYAIAVHPEKDSIALRFESGIRVVDDDHDSYCELSELKPHDLNRDDLKWVSANEVFVSGVVVDCADPELPKKKSTRWNWNTHSDMRSDGLVVSQMPAYDSSMEVRNSSNELIAKTADNHNGSNVVTSCWSPNGRYFLTGHKYNYVTLWNVDPRIAPIQLNQNTGIVEPIAFTSFDAGSKLIATSSGISSIRLWETGGELITTIPIANELKSLRWHPQQSLFAVLEKSSDKILIRSEDDIVSELQSNDSEFVGFAWSKSGKDIFAIQSDNSLNEYRFDDANHKRIASFQAKPLSIKISPDGNSIALILADGNVQVLAINGSPIWQKRFDPKFRIEVNWHSNSKHLLCWANDIEGTENSAGSLELSLVHVATATTVWQRGLSGGHSGFELRLDSKSQLISYTGWSYLNPPLIDATSGKSVSGSAQSDSFSNNWNPDNSAALSMSRNGTIQVSDPKYLRTQYSAFVFRDGETLRLTSAGQLINPSAKASDRIRYIVEFDDGHFETLTNEQFQLLATPQ